MPEIKTLPWTDKVAEGEVVPMPTLPLPLIIKSVEVATAADEEPTAKSGPRVAAFALATDRFAQGVEVPTPTFKVLLLKIWLPFALQ
jgi:hypothetical protein